MSNSTNEQPIKILAWLDSPVISTGFGIVAYNILRMLHETGRYDITICAINHFESWYDQTKYPYKIYGTQQGDPFNVKLLKSQIFEGDFDIFFAIQDLNILNQILDPLAYSKSEIKRKNREIEKWNRSHPKDKKPLKRIFKTVFYAPVDTPLTPQNHFNCLLDCDFPVVYTKFAVDTAIEAEPRLAKKVRYIYHGSEPELFHSISIEEKRVLREGIYRTKDDDTFTVVNVNRNQWRKDLARSMKIFHAFHEAHPNSSYYIHAKMQDVGGHLPSQALMLGLKVETPKGEIPEIVFTDPAFSENKGVPRELMNNAYNAANAVISTTTGEGYGLSLVEAMAAKIPVVFPRNTSLIELIGENEERGYFAECGATEDEWTLAYGSNNYPRPTTNQASMIKALERIDADRDGLEYKGFTREKLEAAYDFAQEYTWDSVHIKGEWLKVFDAASK